MTAEEVAACFVKAARQMQELPFYNPHLEVEVHGWQLLDSIGHLGILITPWCLKLLFIPQSDEGLPAFGEDFNLSLPSGDYQLQAARHELLGSYAAASLSSDMLDFANQSQAREMAVAVMQLLLQAPPEPPENPGRRRLFGGRL
ncbi:[NiFe]-hydrogenase assembly chaperone HybE [Marinospirillum sp.]|uniref:[NiFe]-hydrogenase assembly chaperone HybE n=1 Tax=Marinospirillum sp. TaxID=2183934 RepID=UPI0028708217|nr:[NiFe]-hydrogenase assembly chaperone HybE [Marinospirillum sp.]MDR9468651.1 [NiFe]-hydrogenase assembly chaperone HybE [Marinospirillum sp.]